MKKNCFTLSIATALILLHANINAQEWKELGIGNNALNGNGSINTLAADKSGNIYAGGAIRSYVGPNSSDIFYVAKWDGATWTQLGVGTNAIKANNIIKAIATDTSGNIYAAGQFSYVVNDMNGSHQNHYVAKWDGNTWAELGAGIDTLAANNDIQTVVTDHLGNVYAAGDFSDESHSYGYVAKWNGSTWSELGDLHVNGTIYKLAIDVLGNLYAAGAFTDNNGKIYIAKWNGTSWQHLGGDIYSNLQSSFISDIVIDVLGNVYISGNITDANNKYYVAKLNGNTWIPLGNGSAALNAGGPVLALTIGINNNVYAGGDFSNNSGKGYVAQWNGSNWSETGTGSGTLNANGVINTLLVDRALNLYAAGGFYDNTDHTYVAKFGDSTIIENPDPTGIHNSSSFGGKTTIFPNPAKSEISLLHLEDYTRIDIINISGTIVLSQKVLNKDETINIGNLNPGMYFLQLTGDKGRSVFKLIKE